MGNKAKNNRFTPAKRLRDYKRYGFCVEGQNPDSAISCKGISGKGCTIGTLKSNFTWANCSMCHNTGLTTLVWMVSIRTDCEDQGQTQTVIDSVEAQLKRLNIPVEKSGSRRCLSPGETFLRDLRRIKPYRDSPVLTRLLEEIR